MKNKIVCIFSSHLGDEKNNEFISHIHNTIGVNHDVICYTNYNQYSLTSIYNKAIDQYGSENTIMVFMHPDIIIKTKNWGRILLSKFNSSDFQIIGLAGSTYLPKSGIWWEDNTKMCGIVEHTDGYATWVSEYSPEIKGGIKPVVLIDGVFMAVDCDGIENRFDEEFNDYHFYDLSFVVPNYLDGCNIGVITDIRILHKSVGATNQKWDENRKLFVQKYNNELPISLPPEFNEINLNLSKHPKVSVIIPTKNNYNYLRNNILSWKEIVNYPNYEIIIADTGSDENVIKQYDELLSSNVRLVKYDYYNFAKINNDVVKNRLTLDTELVLFCNDDIKLLNDALTACVDVYNNTNNVGTIGIRLHYGDSSIQHNGISLIKGQNDQLIISHKDIRKSINYSTKINYKSQGNTGGFMLINKNLFNNLNGFNENYLECLEDVELNLKCASIGLNNVTNSNAVAYHYESISRNKLEGGNERFLMDYERLLVFNKSIELMNNENDKLINILTRTHNRPEHFKICKDSIVNQTYDNVKHIIGSDVECNYCDDYIKLDLIDKITNAPDFGTYYAPWNLHLNTLAKHVESGWIMYLDDDDKFVSPESLKIITSNIDNEDQLILWKVNINGNIVPSNNNFGNIVAGDISGIGFMFHSKHLPVDWGSWNFGDYRVINELSKRLKTKWINLTLTQTQGSPNLGREPIN